MPAVLKCFKQKPEIQCPEDWFNASNELVGICIVVGWLMMFIFNMEFLDDNAMLNRLGYNPPGVAMVSTPGKYPCAVIFSVAMYSHLRYCYLDNMRCKLSDATPSMKRKVWMASSVEAFSWLCFPLVFVLTPDKNALVAFCAFACLITGNLASLLMNFYESHNEYHKKGSWVYLTLLTIFALAFVVCEIIQLASYDEDTKELGPIPVGFLVFLEYGWFVLLAVQTRFMPAAPSILFESKIIEDKDYQNEELKKTSPLTFEERSTIEKDKGRPLGLIRLWKSPADVQTPEVWFSASSECMVLAFIVSWTITAIFNTDLIHNNALMERLGYNNICVAWDAPPALYPASIIYSFALYCQLRFCYLDNLRCALSDATPSQKKWTRIANAVQGFSWCVFPLVYVITPDQDALIHSSAFVCMIFGNLFGMWMNFYEMDPKYHKKHSWKYLAFLTLTSIGFPAIVVLQLLTYNTETGELGPAPVWLNVVFDYAWFGALAVQTRFMPAAPSIFFTCSLQEDEDFKFQKPKVAPYDAVKPGDDEAPKTKKYLDASKIICPVIATLYCMGDLECDEDGCCTQAQLKAGLMKTGLNSEALLGALSFPAKKGPFNIFEMKKNDAVAHKVSSCIRNPEPDEKALQGFFDTYVKDPDGGDGVVTAKELGNAWSSMSKDPDLIARSNPKGNPLMIAVWATLLEAFGRTDTGGCYLTKEDMKNFYIDAKYPADWKPHEYGIMDVIKRTRAIQTKTASGKSCCVVL